MQAPKRFKPEPFFYHEIIELKIDTLTNLGLGLGRIQNWVVMVAFALPGERVKVRIYKNHKNYSEGDLLEVLDASPSRIQPLCPLFGTCGGCQYQHLAYEAQLKHKQKHVAELLKHLAKLDLKVNPTRPSPRPYYYRSKLTPHFEKPRKPQEGPMPIGFLKQGSRFSILDVPHCPIATETINAYLPTLRDRVRNHAATYKRGGTLLLRDSEAGVCTDPKAILEATLNTPSGKLKYQFIAGDFFQNNPFILEELIHYTLKQASAIKAPYLIDAYCGVGVFALAGSSLFESIQGIEVSPMAVHLATANAKLNNIANCTFSQGKAENLFEAITFPGHESVMIIDPPRKGCDKVFLDQLLQLRPRRLVYISCAPDTQARDIAYLSQGGYTVHEVQPFDLFPQTRHIENVITLDTP